MDSSLAVASSLLLSIAHGDALSFMLDFLIQTILGFVLDLLGFYRNQHCCRSLS